eukprot:CAMPEP_0185602554 /NCGR_PEP_ID=MMETSP0436-20130131/1866_1 /TAXON_ID=626734 ORGANISM="Favella taraikaensis, Strain Fe Narragansett Bay" /NCGR_SAMPLE_ID=MMETSP0436 /ASSEMBLY_ACC=CAM_ASM_000390 /LENGTH=170 /DNA_ID=CAMNT_0028232787 /DNA_START=371 /DNA_END=881 /DNA_ORIENTATION=+
MKALRRSGRGADKDETRKRNKLVDGDRRFPAVINDDGECNDEELCHDVPEAPHEKDSVDVRHVDWVPTTHIDPFGGCQSLDLLSLRVGLCEAEHIEAAGWVGAGISQNSHPACQHDVSNRYQVRNRDAGNCLATARPDFGPGFLEEVWLLLLCPFLFLCVHHDYYGKVDE